LSEGLLKIGEIFMEVLEKL